MIYTTNGAGTTNMGAVAGIAVAIALVAAVAVVLLILVIRHHQNAPKSSKAGSNATLLGGAAAGGAAEMEWDDEAIAGTPAADIAAVDPAEGGDAAPSEAGGPTQSVTRENPVYDGEGESL